MTRWIQGNTASPRWWEGGPCETSWGWRTATSPPGTPCSTSVSSSLSETWMKLSNQSNSSKGEDSVDWGVEGTCTLLEYFLCVSLPLLNESLRITNSSVTLSCCISLNEMPLRLQTPGPAWHLVPQSSAFWAAQLGMGNR